MESRMMNSELWNAVAVVVVTFIGYQILNKVLWRGIWTPLRLRRIMVKQGVRGPPFRFPFGQVLEFVSFMNSFPEVVPLDSYADLSPTVTPQYALYYPQFPGAKYFLYWWGKTTRLCVRDPEIAKEVFINNHAHLKCAHLGDTYLMKGLIGRGLVALMGEKWSTERRAINPFFHQDALKGMVEAMVEGTATEIQKWEQIVAQAGGSAEIDIEADMHKISGRILSLTAFGTDSEKGFQVYETQTELAKEYYQMLRGVGFWIIPRYSDIPLKSHRHMRQMAKKIDTLLHEILDGRLEAVRKGVTNSYGNDLLGRMLTSAADGWSEGSPDFNLQSVIENSKLFYFAGQDTVANASLFTMLMLTLHPEWQDRARAEVMEVVGDEESFDASVLSRLKVVGMVVNETMRTFTIAPTMVRLTGKDLQLKNLFIPEGVVVEFSTNAVHQDKEYWGEDAAEFKPERFANGVAAACSHPQAFVPFGLGPKICIGNNFAMMELKIIVSKVLRRFQLLPSPNYKHHPCNVVVTRPKYGLPIILKAL
ncbi:hypothetical protein M758_4G222100 [Ceratodon purpureus]|nr:hypothetical protein M758_4G222100 [Ceratodon purpureus]